MELQICMIPSPEDPPLRSDDYQSELRHLGLTLRASGLEICEVCPRPIRSEMQSTIQGEWRVRLDPVAALLLGTPVRTWLQARRGRAARLKVGEIEADVRTVEELVSVIQIANRYQRVAEMDS